MNRSSRVGVAIFFLAACVAAQGQSTPLDSELKRLQGSWRVTEMVDNGRVLSDVEMQRGLPGGGVMDIVDYTMLFKSPVDGTRSTRSFRLNPTSYPKEIVVSERDRVTGVGIYQLDKGKFVVCVAAPDVPPPTDFNAPPNSQRTMLVLEPYLPSKDSAAEVKFPPPPTNASYPISRPPQPIPTPAPAPAPTPSRPPQPAAVPPSINQSVAARVLTDADVTRMLVGNWKMNDGEGLVDISINANRSFSTFRHTETMSNFHSVFVPKPVSTGTWNVQGGQLNLIITSSWRSDRTNTQATFSVRSISGTDAIIVDALGRVIRAVRRP